MIGIPRIAQRADSRIPAARREIRAEPGRHVAGERLHPLVRRVAVRIEVDVGQPVAPDARAHERFRQQRIRHADERRDVLPERAVAPGVEHVIGRQLLQLERHLRTVGVLHRMEDEVHLLEDVLERLVGHEQLREPQDVARRRNLVRVLPSRDEDRRLVRRELRERYLLARRRIGDLEHRDIAAAIRAAGLVRLHLGKRRELADQFLALVG